MKIKKRFFLFILFLFIAYNSSAQESPNPFTIYNQGIAENNYLTPLIELQKDEFTKSEQWRSIVPDLLGLSLFLHRRIQNLLCAARPDTRKISQRVALQRLGEFAD
jgi:hypothetical protein